MGTKKGILRFFYPFLNFVEKELEAGNSVLIHCLAGAHRAGTSGVAWLMYKKRITPKDATDLAKTYRAKIDPLGSFPNLLSKLNRALEMDKDDLEEILSKIDVQNDADMI